VRAIAGTGLQGDRYSSGEGTWSQWPGDGRQVTLIESEVIVELEQSMAINAAQMRRNIVTYGAKLNELIGIEFTIGEVVFKGVRQCEPCSHIEKLTVRGLAAALDNRGGLRADILVGGCLRVGDNLVLDR
jgi:MOSC domain-containing protein YiiM